MNSPKTPSLFCSSKSILEQTEKVVNQIVESGATVGYRIPPNGFSLQYPFLRNGYYLSIPSLEYAVWLQENGFEQNDIIVESKFDVQAKRAEIEQLISHSIPTFVVDHFVQAEEICKVAASLQRRVSFEIEIRSQYGVSGVPPGPDALELKKGIEKLPESKWVGFHFKGLQQIETAKHLLENFKAQSPHCPITGLVQEDEKITIADQSPFSCYLLPLLRTEILDSPDFSIIASIVSRPRRDIAVIDLGGSHFRNGIDLSNVLTQWRSLHSSEWFSLNLLSINEYEIGMEIPADCGNVLIGSQIEIALMQPRGCLLPIQFV